MKVFVPLLALLLLFAGCESSVSSRKVMPLEEFKRIHVDSRTNDNHHVDELLAAELRRHGRDATFGPHTMMPENADAVLTYVDTWTGDFHHSILELNLELTTVRGHKKIAEARYYQPKIVPAPEEKVIRELVDQLFK